MVQLCSTHDLIMRYGLAFCMTPFQIASDPEKKLILKGSMFWLMLLLKLRLMYKYILDRLVFVCLFVKHLN